jgi:hypothetical protein
VVSLGTHLHGLVKVLGSDGEDHELLEREGVSSVGSTVDDVERRAGEVVGRLDASEVGKVDVEGDTLAMHTVVSSKRPGIHEGEGRCSPSGQQQPWR